MEKKPVNINQLLTIIALIVVGFGVGFVLPNFKKEETSEQGKQDTTQDSSVATPAVDMEAIKKAFSEATIQFGDDTKKVIFIEISDPSCPYCQIAGGYNGKLNSSAGERFTLVEDGGTYVAPVKEMRRLVESGDAAFAMIYQNGHNAGEMGMKALYCAFELGKFWEAKELIFSSEGYDLMNNEVINNLSKSDKVADFLSSVVDKNEMVSCLDSGKYNETLTKDSSTAKSLGVRGTPNFFVNDKSYAGAYSFEEMRPVVDAALGE
jgi:protein-disulfide isomerase